jgi:glycosyltransferase involved in cell wall biosynthesis
MSTPFGRPDSVPARAATAVVTIIAKNYLAQARVLMASAKQADPSHVRFVLLVDDPEDLFDPAKEDFTVVASSEIGIPKSRWFHFKYSVLEVATAVKPFFLRWLFQRYNFDKIIYLDPDIRIYAPLDGIASALDAAPIALTPHITEALNDDRQPSELSILRSGTYNLGFIGLRNTPEVDRFLLWWQSRLYDYCVVDPARGLFVDQRWIDLVPGMFSGVSILRDAGYNVAYWNAAHRAITWRGGTVLVNGGPLYFFHFSGYDPGAPDVLSKHQDRVLMSDREDLKTLFEQYRRDLSASGFPETSAWPYTHARFRNGCVIPDIGRHLFYEAPQLLDEIDDPFSDEGYGRLVDLWNTPISRSNDGRFGITKLAYRIYRLREDVQAAMPDIFGSDHVRFLEWMLSSGPHEHFLSEPLLSGIRAALNRTSAQEGANRTSRHGSNDLPPICADLLENGTHNPILAKITGRRSLDSPAVFNEVNDGRISHLTVLARYLYESRPDLQRVFPDPSGRDEAAYLGWLLSYGRHGYALTEDYVAPLRRRLQTIRSGLPLAGKMRLDLYRALFAVALKMAPLTTAIRNARGAGIPGRRARSASSSASGPIPSHVAAAPAPFGVNVYGYFRSEMGVGQSARNGIDALTAAGIEYSVHNLHAAGHSALDKSVARFSTSAPYGANLYFVNADQTAIVQGRSGRTAGRYYIAFWTWELDELPREWDQAYRSYDEIWVPSGFCQAAVAARAPVPVVRIPYCVRLPAASRKTRADFGIDPGRFVFLSVFDMRSCFDRKNPLAVLRAFRDAFGKREDCELIVKVNHADAFPERLRCLREQAAEHSARLMEETFRHEDVAALIAASDCVVSLHRSEGFGLVLGEAMLMGKPVIATAYSGNLDFTTPSTAFLVSYQKRRVGPGNAPYPEDCLWADPCAKDAARQMYTVYENAELRAERAKAGRDLIKREFSPAAVGAAMEARLRLVQGR